MDARKVKHGIVPRLTLNLCQDFNVQVTYNGENFI